MLTITVELLHDTIRATAAADTAIMGVGDAGEWPPSPARLFAAFVAAEGTTLRARVVDCGELRVLERAVPPRIVADGLEVVLRSSLEERFVVVDRTALSSVQEYPARTAALVRPGVRLAPCSREVAYVWDDLVVDDATLEALRRRAARIAYFGCADSPARVTVSTESPEGDAAWVPSDDGEVVLPVAYEGFLVALDEAFERERSGETTRRSWIPNRFVRYRSPTFSQEPAAEPTVLWLRFTAPMSGRRLRAVTEALRAALLEEYDRDFGAVPPVLHGHGFEGRGYQHAHFLALPDVGHPHARGRLHGAAVLLPSGTGPEIVEGVRSALWRITTLVAPGVLTKVRPYADEPRPVAATPQRWLGPTRHWVSATPVVHERFLRKGPDLNEITRWCEHAGVAARPVSFRIARPPLLDGAISLHPSEVVREGRERRPYSHLEVLFEEPVLGPVVLGAARQFGFGLMFPVDSRSDSGA